MSKVFWNSKDLVGEEFNRLLIIKFLYIKKSKRYWLCECSCGSGKRVKADTYTLVLGNIASCGKCPDRKAHNFVDLTGKSFNRLIVTKYLKRNEFGQSLWECLCSCGNKNPVIACTQYLVSGHTKSCGCYKIEKFIDRSTTHGLSKIDDYHLWSTMIQRCTNPNCTEYFRYGGRGITVCERWQGEDGFIHFFEDMGPRPSRKYSINRIDNDLLVDSYSKANCEWVTKSTQTRNTRVSAKTENYDEHLKWKGYYTQTLSHFLASEKDSPLFKRLFGITLPEFKAYIESLWLPDMTWENRGINKKGVKV